MYKISSQQGMSLVEMIITIALFSIVSFAVASSIHSFYRQNAYVFAQAYQLQNARVGVDALTRDVREMIYADDGAFPLVIMQPHHIGFYSDIDRDESVEYVEYEIVNDTDLVKRVYNAVGTPPVYDLTTPDQESFVSQYVQNYLDGTVTFEYFDNTHTAISNATLTDVRYVKMQLVINIDPVRDPGQYMLKTSAYLRNIN